MASGSLGSESLILTADAQGLYQTLDQSTARMRSWSKQLGVSTASFYKDQSFQNSLTKDEKAYQAYAQKIQGERAKQAAEAQKQRDEDSKANALFWAKTAAIAFVAFKGIEAGGKLFNDIVGKVKTGTFDHKGRKLGDEDKQKLLQANASIEKFAAKLESFAGKMLAVFSPVIELIADTLSEALEELSPVFEYVGRIASSVFVNLIEIAKEIVSAVWEVITTIGQWVSELLGLGDVSESVESVITTGFKYVIKGAALVWDAVKGIAGAFAYVASYAVDGFGHIVDVFKDTIKDLLELAGRLPDDLGGKWFRDQAGQVDQFGNRVLKAADDMRKWAKGTWANFGNSVTDVDKWFEKRAKRPPKEAIPLSVNYQASAATLKGSKEAYSIVTKFNESNKLNGKVDIAKEQLKEAKAANGWLSEIVKKVQQKPAIQI